MTTPPTGDQLADLAITPAEHWPSYAQDEIDAVVATLRSGKVNQWTGTRVREFQTAYEQHVGVGQAIALANGSLALELVLRAFDIGPGDEVIVTPRTFVASAFCVMLVGATPVFADVDPDSGNITAESIADKITDRTVAVIPVHLAGWPADMPGICAIAREHNLWVLEDCAQAHGALIDGAPVGSFGQAAAFSFCQDKIMTTGGEGGLALLRDEDAFNWAWSFKDHGKSRAKVFEPNPAPGFRWLHDSVGTNWRMLETSAVIGLAQLAKLEQWRAARAERAAIWAEALGGIDGLRVPTPDADLTHAHYKFYAYVDRPDGEAEPLRDQILAESSALGIRAFSGSCSEVYLEEAFRELSVDRLPVARRLGETSLMFEVHPTLDLDRLRARAVAVADVARRVLG
ncbi:MAG: DegT/DnrJ/EryC1/StrS aminotransferase family protein [Gaiellales bacterium]